MEKSLKNEKIMRIILTFLFLTLTLNANLLLAAEDSLSQSQEASTLEVVFVKEVVTKGITLFSDQETTPQIQRDSFRELLKESFDMNVVAKFSIGSYWRQMNEEQKKAYLNTFENYIVNIYSKQFSDYKGQQFEFKNRTINIGADVIVSSDLVVRSGDHIHVDWRVRNKSGEFKIIDVVISGVSMSITQRSEFSTFLQNADGNVDLLISKLSEKAE